MTPTNLIVPIAVSALAFLTWVLFRLVRMTWRGDTAGATRLATKVTGLWAVGLLLVTLGGRPQYGDGATYFAWTPFRSVVPDSEHVVNFLLFTPAALLLPWIARRTPLRVIAMALLGGVVLSSAIEVVQTFTVLGTGGDVTDILLNTAGATTAATLAATAHYLLSQRATAPVLRR